MTTPTPHEGLSRDEAVLLAMELLHASNPSPAALTEIGCIEREVAEVRANPQGRRSRIADTAGDPSGSRAHELFVLMDCFGAPAT